MKSSNYYSFEIFDENKISSFVSTRPGETKLGSNLAPLNKAKYVILGIEESIGPRANFGRGGAEHGFNAFLSVFLNMQSNESLSGDSVCVLGRVIRTEVEEDEDLREMTKALDDFVGGVLNKYISSNQIPIVIGGGHNNAYPLIRFSSLRLNQPVNVINFDAHADYRLLEGRHSGNSFSYGFSEGFIKRYYVLGLHQRYNSQQILDYLRRDNQYFTFHEEYVLGNRNYLNDFKELAAFFNQSNDILGVELDLDTIERMPSSASSPVGISIDTARQYINQMAQVKSIAYVHFPEGAPMNLEENRIVGKTLAYFVSDFLSSHDAI